MKLPVLKNMVPMFVAAEVSQFLMVSDPPLLKTLAQENMLAKFVTFLVSQLPMF